MSTASSIESSSGVFRVPVSTLLSHKTPPTSRLSRYYCQQVASLAPVCLPRLIGLRLETKSLYEIGTTAVKKEDSFSH